MSEYKACGGGREIPAVVAPLMPDARRDRHADSEVISITRCVWLFYGWPGADGRMSDELGDPPDSTALGKPYSKIVSLIVFFAATGERCLQASK